MRSLPYELNLAIEGLNNQQRQEILFALQEVNRLSFSELSKRVSIDRSLLANHLKVLLKTLLVEHYYDQKVGNEAFSFYAISPLGKAILNRLLGTLYSLFVQSSSFLFTKTLKQGDAVDSLGDDVAVPV